MATTYITILVLANMCEIFSHLLHGNGKQALIGCFSDSVVRRKQTWVWSGWFKGRSCWRKYTQRCAEGEVRCALVPSQTERIVTICSMLRLKYPQWELSDDALHMPIACVLVELLPFKIFVTHEWLWWLPIFFTPKVGYACGFFEIFLHKLW